MLIRLPRAAAALAGHAGALLEIRDVALRFGGIVALDGVSFALNDGEILGLIGPNGAGKTTLFNCISRLYTPNRGDILFAGSSLLARKPHRIAEIGIARTFQNLALFGPQSVLDNVRIGGHARGSGDFLTDALRLPATRRPRGGADRYRLGFARHARSARCRAAPGRRPAARHAQAGRAGARAGRATRSCCCSTSRPAG